MKKKRHKINKGKLFFWGIMIVASIFWFLNHANSNNNPINTYHHHHHHRRDYDD